MTTIENHSNGAFQLPNFQGVIRNTRIKCNEKWVIATDRQMNPATKAASIPFYFLPRNGILHINSQGELTVLTQNRVSLSRYNTLVRFRNRPVHCPICRRY
jgi:hypothetical protein